MNPYFKDKNITLYNCDVMEGLAQIPDESVQCVVTSPPYFGLRDYGIEGQMGLENSPEEYTENMVVVFREVNRVLKKDGTLWLNIGDSYAGSGKGRMGDGSEGVTRSKKQSSNAGAVKGITKKIACSSYLKPKDLIGIPWRLALALQSDGWYNRQDIIWIKPNPMPESVTDRCTKSHEYIFLLTKSSQYFYDAEAIREKAAYQGQMRGGSTAMYEQNNFGADNKEYGMRNKRSTWSVNPATFKGAHFAVFPPKLIEPCILAGSRPNDTVLDPFWGSGTTGEVAIKHGRKVIGIEINPDYCELSKKRFKQGTLGFYEKNS